VRPVVAAHEIQRIGDGGVRGGLERFLAGRRNRPRRQAGVAVGVVRRIDHQIVVPQIAVVPAGQLQRVDDRRIALETHAYHEAVGVDRGDEGALIGTRGFLLHDRRERDQLPD